MESHCQWTSSQLIVSLSPRQIKPPPWKEQLIVHLGGEEKRLTLRQVPSCKICPPNIEQRQTEGERLNDVEEDTQTRQRQTTILNGETVSTYR